MALTRCIFNLVKSQTKFGGIFWTTRGQRPREHFSWRSKRLQRGHDAAPYAQQNNGQHEQNQKPPRLCHGLLRLHHGGDVAGDRIRRAVHVGQGECEFIFGRGSLSGVAKLWHVHAHIPRRGASGGVGQCGGNGQVAEQVWIACFWQFLQGFQNVVRQHQNGHWCRRRRANRVGFLCNAPRVGGGQFPKRGQISIRDSIFISQRECSNLRALKKLKRFCIFTFMRREEIDVQVQELVNVLQKELAAELRA